jgi:hypothetical protein
MHRDETVLHDEFQRARQAAMEVTDRFYDCRADDPSRPALWDAVVRQTETARQLLERWLQRPPATDIEPIARSGEARVQQSERR